VRRGKGDEEMVRGEVKPLPGGESVENLMFQQIQALSVRVEKDGKRVDDVELFGLTRDGRVARYILVADRWLVLSSYRTVTQ
jgi:hypothetical protein